jgi:hypothetical protein
MDAISMVSRPDRWTGIIMFRVVEWWGTSRGGWARHGSTRWLFEKEAILAARAYSLEKQGIPMATYNATEP